MKVAINAAAAFERVRAAEALVETASTSPACDEAHRIEAFALLAAVRNMIDRRQYDAAFWTVRDLCNKEEGRRWYQRDGYIYALLDLEYTLDGLRNAIETNETA